jgi:hypothetical protein
MRRNLYKHTKNKIYYCLIILIIVTIGIASCRNAVLEKTELCREVTEIEAEKALSIASLEIGSEYVYGSNGPTTFDCSGLIIWSYQQVFNKQNIFKYNDSIANDLSIEMLFQGNVNIIQRSEVFPGDIIFITNEKDSVTHGGIVVKIDNDNVTFINASSYYGIVTNETWNINDTVRDQWIVGFGRLMICE